MPGVSGTRGSVPRPVAAATRSGPVTSSAAVVAPEYATLLRILEQQLLHDPLRARILLSSEFLQSEPGFYSALFSSTRLSLRVRRLWFALVLEQLRTAAGVPETAFDAESQIEPAQAAGGGAVVLGTQPVLQFESQFAAPTRPTEQQAPEEGRNSARVTETASSQPKSLSTLELYAFVRMCVNPAALAWSEEQQQQQLPEREGIESSSGPGGTDAVDRELLPVVEAIEADRRATVNLGKIARLLRASAMPTVSPAAVENADEVDADVVEAAEAAAACEAAVEDAAAAIAELQGEEEMTEQQDRKRNRAEEAVENALTPNEEGAPAEGPATMSILPAAGRVVALGTVADFDLVLPGAAGSSHRGGAALGAALNADAVQPGHAIAPRLRTNFASPEDEAILRGVQMFSGAGRWTSIFNHFRVQGGVWHESRTPASLAERYKNVLRRSRLLGNPPARA
jgi:hypothetical protein